MSVETDKVLMEKEHHLYEKQCDDTVDWVLNEFNSQESWDNFFNTKLPTVNEHKVKLGLAVEAAPPGGSQFHLVTLLSH